MGAAIAAGIIVAGGTVAAGSMANNAAEDQNNAMRDASKSDYNQRIAAAQAGLKKINDEFNDILEKRPNTSWTSFIKKKMAAVNDPAVRDFYVNAKEEDFARLQEFANRASKGNVNNLLDAADEISGGRWREFVGKRNDLIANTDAASRYQRAYELAAPVRGDASTVRYDDQGRLIEGQRADKQAFNIATEVQTGIEQEQKQDLRAAENDRLNAAASQVQKAGEFTAFFDPTGYANRLSEEQTALEQGWQAADEARSFDLYKMFAGAAAGITAVQPNYVNPNPGDALIAQGVKSGTDSLMTYYKDKNSKPASNPY